MGYLFEIHCHTSESSGCASETAESTVKAYKERGYAGVVVTDHLGIGGGKDNWADHCRRQQAGYRNAKAVSEKYGMTVLYAAEITVAPNWGNDFLVLGLTPEWWVEHPELDTMSLNDVLKTVRGAGAFISHAHPFREANYIRSIVLVPRLVDAAEVNANRDDFVNDRAVEYAKAYSLKVTAGSDNHVAHRQARLFGMDFEECPQTEKQLAELLFAEKYELKTENYNA